MATQQAATNGKGKGAKPIPAKAPKEEPKQEIALIPTVKAKALSLTVGPMFVKTLAKAEQDIEAGEALTNSGKARKATAMSELCLAIVKAAKADTAIDLSAIVRPADDKASKKVRNFVFAQLRVAIGVQHVVTVKGKDGKEMQRVDYTPEMSELFPAKGENKDSPGWQPKETLRSNFMHSLTDAASAAAAIVERDMVASVDKASGVLRLSGPAVKKEFGTDSVLVNEKQKQHTFGKNGKVTGEATLEHKPSFAALKRVAQAAEGVSVRGPVSNNRTLTNMTPEAATIKLCTSLVEMLQKVKGEPSEKLKAAMESAHSALDKLL